ncbi:unnamed protein product [Linum tenue]|uniref:Uncharacterized protein n=1 Tax=Linum tenue TaxID=586396 RepID=A0AAV0J844_9ROSI|nr:unnamed protein product [Linum tenue]
MLAGFGSGLSRTIFIDEGKARDEPVSLSLVRGNEWTRGSCERPANRRRFRESLSSVVKLCTVHLYLASDQTDSFNFFVGYAIKKFAVRENIGQAGISDDMKGYCVLGSRNKHISIRRIMLCYGYEALKMRGFSTPRDWLGSSEIKWRF